MRVSTRAGPSLVVLVCDGSLGLWSGHTVFFAGANLGRPSSSMCISVSASPTNETPLLSDGTFSGASSNKSSSWPIACQRLRSAGPIYHILSAGSGTLTASIASVGCFSSAVGAGMLLFFAILRTSNYDQGSRILRSMRQNRPGCVRRDGEYCWWGIKFGSYRNKIWRL